MNKIFDDFVKNKIKVMDGIDFKKNQERIRKKDKIKENEYKQNKKEKNVFIVSFTILIIIFIFLLFNVSKTTEKAINECTKKYSLNYCQNHIL